MKSNISSLIKEIKKNVEGRSKSCCFMSLHGNTVKERKMLPLNPDVFPRKEGVILVSGAPLVQLCLTIKSLVMPEMRIALRFPRGLAMHNFFFFERLSEMDESQELPWNNISIAAFCCKYKAANS